MPGSVAAAVGLQQFVSYLSVLISAAELVSTANFTLLAMLHDPVVPESGGILEGDCQNDDAFAVTVCLTGLETRSTM
jgi:hypothetical protein